MAHLSPGHDGSFITACVAEGSIDAMAASLRQRGFSIRELSFFERDVVRPLELCLAACFEAEPAISLDAIADVAWQRLMADPYEKACILWRDGGTAIRKAPQQSLDCVEVIMQIATAVAQESRTDWSHPVWLRLVIAGTGPGYPEWDGQELTD
jgi:hypothetical protein